MSSSSLVRTLVLLLILCSSTSAQQSAGSVRLQNAQRLMRQGSINEALPLLLEVHRDQPRNAAICQQIGIAYTQLQQFTEAERFYRMALSINPQLLPARKNLGVVLWFSNQKKEAEREFEVVLKTSPDDPVPHFYLGMREYEQPDYSKARDHFLKAGSLALENPEAFPAVLEMAMATKDQDFVDRLVSSANKSTNFDQEVWFQAGITFARYGSYDRAVQAFERIRDSYPDKSKLIRNLGLAQLQAHRYAAAVQSFEILAPQSSAPNETYLLLAEAYDGAGLPEKAYDAYAQAIEKDPKSEEGYAVLSNFAVAHHNTSFALEVLNRGLKSLPGSARLLLQQGVIQALDDKMPQAEDSFRQASRNNPSWLLPWLCLGLTQLQTARLEEAVRSFQAGADFAKDDYRPNYLLALAWVRGGGQNQSESRGQIVSALKRALKLNPDHADSHVLLGQTYLSGNELELAITELQTARRLQPENPTALYQLATAYRKKGRLTEAQVLMKQFEGLKTRQKQEEDLARKELVQILKVSRDR
ncbi:MAG: tetratricopeptide repeat protein [Acidobacteria bacterium]|nr:tetratricopeptide repeat protein [Acidobacteriota bacterium]